MAASPQHAPVPLSSRAATERLTGHLVLAAVFFSAFPGGLALAQQSTAGEPVGVMDQPRADYDAQGLAIGDWMFFPALIATANYDDNIFRLPRGNNSDWFVETTPIARLQRSMGNSQFSISANADNFTYGRLDRLNLTDWTLGADGQTTIGKSLTAAASGYYGEYHEGFESADILGSQSAPTRFFRGHAESVVNYQPGDWALTAGASFDTYSWNPTTLLDGTHIGNEDRDESLFAPYMRVSYDFTRGYQLFARASYDRRDFAQAVDRFGFQRSSSGYHLDGGLAIALDTSWRGEAFAGYLRQNFSRNGAAPLPEISALDYGADVIWYASPALTMHVIASRSLSDIIFPGVAVSDDQSIRLSADWQPRKDIIVQGSAAFTDSQLLGIPRTDRYPSAALIVRYLINRFASAQVGYYYTSRRSDAPQVDFEDESISVGFNLHI
jgi:hypothetical protein